jgi:archaellum component FlaC
VLKTFTEQSTGWRNRNIVFRNWVHQDFKKTTDVTVEEMATVLNSLGDKLERHEPMDQFMKPLNMLAGYYKHQLDQMKGMHKVSRNQEENIETINTWIKDVENLLETLGS